MRVTHGLRRAADGKVPVEIAEITVPDASCVEHQHIAGGKRPVAWRGNDIVIAVGAGAADQIAHIIHAGAKRLGLEPAEQPGQRNARPDPCWQSLEDITGKPADMPDLGDLAARLDHADALHGRGHIVKRHVVHGALHAVLQRKEIGKRHAKRSLAPHHHAQPPGGAEIAAQHIPQQADAVILGSGR